MRTGDLTQSILNKYGTDFGKDAKYTALTQVRGSTGWGENSDTTADLMILGNWPSSGSLLEGFEVKISRADWLNEVKVGGSKAKTKKFCDKWWLVITDKDMVKDGELPNDWGMMAVVNGKLKVVKEAPLLNPEPLPKTFIASLLRHSSKEEVPVDVVKERIKDAKREAEADCKLKYSLLLAYVKQINKVFGITMEFHDVSQKKWLEASHWTAKVKGRWHTYTDEELVELIKAALSEDLKALDYKMQEIKKYAKRILDLETES